MRVLFAISRAATVEVTYTTIHMAEALLRRGHKVRFVEPWDFEIDPMGRLIARAHAFNEPLADRQELVRLLTERRAARRYVEVSQVDAILLRLNPMDPAVIAFAQLVQRAGIPVHNDPRSMLFTAHKGYLASLTAVPTPRTLVTRCRATARLFASDLRAGVVVKPARASGGRGVSLVRSSRQVSKIDEAFDMARLHGDGYVVVQEYLADAEQGEKRLVWLDGELIGGYLRARAPGEFRHNLTRGGNPNPYTITEADQALVRRVSPHLLRDGVWLAGLDVIGDKLLEVNTLNPGGVHYGDTLNGTNMADRIAMRLEQEFESSGRTERPSGADGEPVEDHAG